MWPLVKSIIWDPASARAFFLAALAFGAAYVAQPTGRAWWERALLGAPMALGVGAASAPSAKSRDLEAELAELRARFEAISGPKP